MNFEQQLRIGKIGESAIARWLNSRGFHVLPVYEKEINEGKGPTLFCSNGMQQIAPDLLAFKEGKAFWFEAKHKTAFTWHRNTSRWVTGIDLRHYDEYLSVQSAHREWPIWLLFLHRTGTAKDTPQGMVSPSGLFGESLIYLSENENHRHKNWGRSGMVYWSNQKLKFIAPLHAVMESAA